MAKKETIKKVKPRSWGGRLVKVHGIQFEGIANDGKPYAVTFCSNYAVDWDATNEKISCAVCLRLKRRGGLGPERVVMGDE